jgi:hypothetical protein
VNIVSERELRALIQDGIPADQFVEAAEYLLARDPLIGDPTDDLLVRAMPMAPIGEAQIVLGLCIQQFDGVAAFNLECLKARSLCLTSARQNARCRVRTCITPLNIKGLRRGTHKKSGRTLA